VTSLLVTNDFPPKLGGIQSYLYELWRRLPPDDTVVLTTAYDGDTEWDARQDFRVVRAGPVLLPRPSLARRVDALAREVDAAVIFLDPWLPLGQIGPSLAAAPYVVIVHGAEVTVPGHLPGTRAVGARVLRGAAGIVAAGHYPAREAERAARTALRGVLVPPGVDVARFRPFPESGRADARRAARREFGLDPDTPLVLGVSRLVPRKGFDVLIDAVAGLPGVHLAIAGDGRDRDRLERRARDAGLGARVHFLGRVPDDESFVRLYACADVFAAPCRDRWRGLEAEGFGIVFLEAAAAGVPAVAGRSGGSHEAVVDGETGFVVESRAIDVRAALSRILDDDVLRAAMGEAARRRAVAEFAYEHRVARLAPIAAGDFSGLGPLG
jgi:phosphatidylinositol alpha-1,6-mannosyltransferase